MSYSKEEIEAEDARRQQLSTPTYSPEEFAAEDARRQQLQETQQFLGNPRDSNFDTTGLEPWQYQGGLTSGSTRKPGFLKTAEGMVLGTHKATSEYTLGVMSMIPGVNQKKIKSVSDRNAKAVEDYKKHYSGVATETGELIGDMLPTASLGGLYTKLGKGALALARGEAALPAGTNLLAGYSAGAAGGAGLLAGQEAVKYQGQPFDVGQAGQKIKGVMTDPMAYGMGAGAMVAGRYLDKAREFNKAVDSGMDVLPIDMIKNRSAHILASGVFDSVGMLNPLSRRMQQLQNIGESIGHVIQGIAGSPAVLAAADYKKMVARHIQKGLTNLNKSENELWNAKFKNTKVNNMADISDKIGEAEQLITGSGVPNFTNIQRRLASATKMEESTLATALGISKTPTMTFEDIKKVGTILGETYSTMMRTGLSTEATKLSKLRKEILDVASGNMSDSDLVDYTAAKNMSKHIFDLEDNIPDLQKAAVEEVEALKVVEGIMSNAPNFNKKKAMGIMGSRGQDLAKAAKVAESLAKARGENGVNLDIFLKEASIPPNRAEASGTAVATEALLGNEYKHVQGLAKHLRDINLSKKIGLAGKGIIGTAALVGGGAAVTGNLDVSPLAPVATYAAMAIASSHPVLKRLLGASTRKLSDSMYNHLNNKIQEYFIKAGYHYNDDGSLSEEKN